MSRVTLSGTKLIEHPWECPQCGAHGLVTRRLRRPLPWQRKLLNNE